MPNCLYGLKTCETIIYNWIALAMNLVYTLMQSELLNTAGLEI